MHVPFRSATLRLLFSIRNRISLDCTGYPCAGNRKCLFALLLTFKVNTHEAKSSFPNFRNATADKRKDKVNAGIYCFLSVQEGMDESDNILLSRSIVNPNQGRSPDSHDFRHPSHPAKRDSGSQRAETMVVLTVARQSTIFTWFPIIPF